MLTCAGRRNYLVRFFQEALDTKGLVFVSDTNSSAATMQEADKAFKMPPVNSPEYLDRLLEICQEHQIRLLISLNDLELPVLAKERDRFLKLSTIPVISKPEVVDTCFDKWATFQFLNKCGILAPKTYLSLDEARQAISSREIDFPLVIKPRWGSASIAIEYVENAEELELAYRYVYKKVQQTILADISAVDPDNCILIQEKISGQEYGLDVFNDFSCNYVNTFVKRKLYMRAGETDRAITVRDKQLETLGAEIANKLGHLGNLDCDVIVNPQGNYVLEMNPRFGGGYPFTHLAGVNLPATLIAWANGEVPDPNWLILQANVLSSKCDRLIVHQQ